MMINALTPIGRLDHPIGHVRIVALLAVALAHPTFADDSAWDLRIDVLNPGDTVRVAEPVLIRATVTNTGDQPQSVLSDLSMVTQTLEILVAEGDGAYRTISPGVVVEPARAMTLEPGKGLSTRQILLFDAGSNGVAFPSAGDYRVRAAWQTIDNHRIESNVHAVSVRAPDDDEVEIVRLILRPEIARAINGLSTDETVIEDIESIARSRTRYASYAAWRLAELVLAGNEFGLPVQEAKEKKSRRARAALGWLEIADRPEFPLRDQVLFQRGFANLLLDDRESAVSIFNQLVKDFPESHAALDARTYLDHL